MIKYWKELLIITLIITSVLSIKTCTQRGQDIELLTNSNDSIRNTVQYYIDNAGDLVGHIITQELSIKQLKDHGDQLGFENKELKKKVGNLNNLVAHWKGKASVSDTIQTVLQDTVYIDGSTGSRFSWENKYLFLDGWTTDSTISIAYRYEVEFSLTAYRKRVGFLKPKQLVTDIYFSDPNFRFKEFRGMVVKEEKKWYERRGVGIAIGFAAGFYLGVR